VHSKENERLATEQYAVKKVCLPKAGKKSAGREEYERQGWYKRARRFRAGIEGRISVMARRGYLGRCRDRGEEGFGRWVGWGVLTANLDIMARTLAAR
jgi:IS5 family transposase